MLPAALEWKQDWQIRLLNMFNVQKALLPSSPISSLSENDPCRTDMEMGLAISIIKHVQRKKALLPSSPISSLSENDFCRTDMEMGLAISIIKHVQRTKSLIAFKSN